MISITSLQNATVKETVRLRESRIRQSSGLFLIDGARELRRALHAGVRLTELFVCPQRCRNREAQTLLDDLLPQLEQARQRDSALRLYEVTPEVLAKLAFGDRDEGFVAVAQMPDTSLSTFTSRLTRSNTLMDISTLPSVGTSIPKDNASAEPLLLGVLEGVEKPGNLGAVIRSADGAGVSGVMVADRRVDLYHSTAIRASLGTVFSKPLASASVPETLAWLRGHPAKPRIFAARVEGSIPYTEADFRGTSAIVVGTEAEGLSDQWYGEDITAISLPMLGIADSLNVSVAAAILFYEARRQRQHAAANS